MFIFYCCVYILAISVCLLMTRRRLCDVPQTMPPAYGVLVRYGIVLSVASLLLMSIFCTVYISPCSIVVPITLGFLGTSVIVWDIWYGLYH